MSKRSTTVELGLAIEALVGSYVEEMRETALRAVRNALVRSGKRERSPRGKHGGVQSDGSLRTRSGRRTTAQMTEACDTLFDVVRAHPGDAIARSRKEWVSRSVRFHVR